MPARAKQSDSEPDKTGGASGASTSAAMDACNVPSYAAIFEAIPLPVILWRLVRDERGEATDLQICAVNHAARALVDLPDVVGRLASDIDPAYRRRGPDFLPICSRVTRTGSTETVEFHSSDLDMWFVFTLAAGPEDLIIAHVSDSTERHASQSALRRARYALDRMADFPAWSDSDGRIVEVSESGCRQLEYTRDELLGMTIFDTTVGLDREAWARSWRELKPGQFFRAEIEHRTKSGKTFPAEITVHSIVFDGVEYHCTFSRDISDRKQAEADLRRLRYSIDQMDDYPTWNDHEGRLIEVSESTCRHLEYTREELLDMTIFDLCPDLCKEGWKKNWETSEPNRPYLVEARHRTKSGRVFPVEITVNPMIFDGVKYHCTFCRDISERKSLEDSLRLTQTSVDNSPDMIHWLDSNGNFIYANRSTCESLGYTLDELQAMAIWDIDLKLTRELFQERQVTSRQKGVFFETTWQTRDGRQMDVEIAASDILRDDDSIGVSFARDITDRKLVENSLKESEERFRQLWEAQNETLEALRDRDEQLLQAQKMEAVGRLAGGIAHDFNNVLTTIIGYSDLILSSPDCPDGPLADDLTEIQEAAHRAASLTQRVLAFSRRQTMQPRILSLNNVVSDTERLLARTIGADIEFKTSLSPDLEQVEVDEQQLVQVLLNLAVNARDAMPEGGTLTVATQNVDLDKHFCKTHPEVHPGRYVKVTVTDTGSGMEPEVVAHVFEPFYTTKPPGLGTGLGLATAYGIVAQSGGCIYVDSEPGRGTTFSLYLPHAEATPDEAEEDTAYVEDAQQAQTLVVVDSDQPFLTLATHILEKRGFRVLPFVNGERAAKVLADRELRIDGLVTDASLSGDVQGTQLAALAVRRRPDLPVLITGADSIDGPQDAYSGDLAATYLEKPFTSGELTHWVQTWLTSPDIPTDALGEDHLEADE